MDPNTTFNAMGELLYFGISPLAYDDPNHDYALKTLCYALAQPFNQVWLLGRADEAGNDPWSIIVDPTLAPGYVLPYIAQLVGENIPVGSSDVIARSQIAMRNNQARGTVASIIAAAQLALTGAKYAHLTERDGSAYRARLNVRDAETGLSIGSYVVNSTNAPLDPLIANLLAVKPVGILLTVVVSAGTTIDELVGTINGLTGTIDSL